MGVLYTKVRRWFWNWNSINIFDMTYYSRVQLNHPLNIHRTVSIRRTLLPMAKYLWNFDILTTKYWTVSIKHMLRISYCFLRLMSKTQLHWILLRRNRREKKIGTVLTPLFTETEREGTFVTKLINLKRSNWNLDCVCVFRLELIDFFSDELINYSSRW